MSTNGIQTKRKSGRPSDYTPQYADRVLKAIAGGMTAAEQRANKSMPDVNTVALWAKGDDATSKAFSKSLAQARTQAADGWMLDKPAQQYREAEEAILDPKLDVRRGANLARVKESKANWMMKVAERMAPDRWGPSVQVNSTVTIEARGVIGLPFVGSGGPIIDAVASVVDKDTGSSQGSLGAGEGSEG